MKRITLILILVLLLSSATFAEEPTASPTNSLFASLSQAWNSIVGMAKDAANGISARAVDSGLADWANAALSTVQSWSDDNGFTEWAADISAQAQKYVAENRPTVEAWLAQAGEEVDRAWNTLVNAEAHTKAEVEAALETVTASFGKTTGFKYVHDPRDNPKAMKDIVYNPDAVYGFSPSPDSIRLREYVDAIDWTNPEQVAEARAQRQAYLDSMSELYRMIENMLGEGKDVETIARAVSQRRNELRLEAYAGDPQNLETVKKSNLDTYGDEMGPSADSLFEKYGSWQGVLEKALGTNMGMDACLGFYDALYDFYDIKAAAKPAGWQNVPHEAVALPTEAQTAFDQALQGLVGAQYTPVALMSTRIDAGTHYCILCQITPVVPNASPTWALVYVYADAKGDAGITNVYDLYIDRHSTPQG